MKIKNSTVESTPFVSIDITDKARNGKSIAWIKLYWTQNAGIYGHQVCSQFNYGDYDKNYTESKTGGCGYSKEAYALQEALRAITGETLYTCHYEASSLFWKYKTGGNHYCLSSRQLLKVCRGIK